ncbi:MAG TPA: polysaccharide deacetylase family protein, partial [Accumulibacter sp.]|nr:polysaccharide deacetylase family protein [Accumulibacter sp.]
DPQRVYRRLRQQLAAGDILLMHDGYAARTPRDVAVIVEVLPRLLQTLRDEDLRPVTLAAAVA